MSQFIPESSLPNHVYIPFYRKPIKKVKDCTYFKNIEIGSDGFLSIINLNDPDGNPVYPFIDIGNFDIETKSWYWLDIYGFPYRIYRDGSNNWYLSALWNINNFGKYLYFDPDDLLYDKNGHHLGFYSLSSSNDEEHRMYTSSPIIVTIEGKIIKDKTIYNGNTNTTSLTKLSSYLNPEFYYDSINNKIYTNQNLGGIDPSMIKIYYYESFDSVSVKCKMDANSGGDALYTPTIDYYILKLDGQHLRG